MSRCHWCTFQWGIVIKTADRSWSCAVGLMFPVCFVLTGYRQQGGAHLGRLHRPEEVLPRGPGGHDRRFRRREGGHRGGQQRLLPEGETGLQHVQEHKRLTVGKHKRTDCWSAVHLLPSPPSAAFRGRWCSWSRLWSTTPWGSSTARTTSCCTRPSSWGRRSCRKWPSSASLMKSCTKYARFHSRPCPALSTSLWLDTEFSHIWPQTLLPPWGTNKSLKIVEDCNSGILLY